MIRITVKTSGKPPVTVELSKLRTTIGRSVRNEICLEDPFASRLHAEIRCEGDVCWLTDLGSANGTYHNGSRIGGTVQVFPGDRLQIGETLLELQIAQAPRRTVQEVTISPDVTAEVIASPQTTLAPSDRTTVTSGLLSVIETVRSAAGAKVPADEAGRGKDLFAVISKVGVALLSQSSLDEVLNQIVDLVFEAVPADRAFLLMRGTNQGELACKVASYRGRQPSDSERQVKISRSITEEVVGKGASVLTSDAMHDERFKQHESIVLSGVRSVMSVPLSVNRQVIGMIYVDSPMSLNCFTDDDLRLLTTIASVAAIKVENALLLEQRIENERIKQQLNSARDIQFRLLPVTPPSVPNYDMTGISFPCFEVGGDYYDFVQRPDGRLLIALGDVSGKGMDAAMLMSSLHASVRAQATTQSSIARLVGEINRYLHENTPSNKFVTLFTGMLDPARNVLTYSNAGHNPPLLIRSAGGDVCYLEEGGLPVGITAPLEYLESEVAFEPGDVLIAYSDGISESANALGEEFTESRLIDVVRKYLTANASQLRDRIDEALIQFVGKAPPVDDMTLVIVKRVA